MVSDESNNFDLSTPLFEKDKSHLSSVLFSLAPEKLQKIYKVSDKTFLPILEEINRQKQGIVPPASPALLTYNGIAFRSMAPNVFDDQQWEYVNEHVRILSAMYGVLRPLDGIVPYRLEMQQKIPFSLYDYWGSRIADVFKGETVICLASKEYCKVLEPWMDLVHVRFFEEDSAGARKEKGVYAKIARGTMVRWMAENQIENPEDLKQFDLLGYQCDLQASTPSCFIFVRKDASS